MLVWLGTATRNSRAASGASCPRVTRSRRSPSAPSTATRSSCWSSVCSAPWAETSWPRPAAATLLVSASGSWLRSAPAPPHRPPFPTPPPHLPPPPTPPQSYAEDCLCIWLMVAVMYAAFSSFTNKYTSCACTGCRSRNKGLILKCACCAVPRCVRGCRHAQRTHKRSFYTQCALQLSRHLKHSLEQVSH